MNPEKLKFLKRWGFVAAMSLQAAFAHAQPVISSLEVGQVGTSEFVATWTVSDDSSLPGGNLFLDEAMTQSVDLPVEFEWYPVPELTAPALTGEYEQRQKLDQVRIYQRERGRVVVRVAGLTPGSTFYFQALARDPDTGVVLTESVSIPVTTASYTRFVAESRQLLLTLDTLPPATRQGALVRLSVDGSPYPLYGTLLNDDSSATAVFDLTALLDASGISQLTSGGLLQVILQFPDLPLESISTDIIYDGSFIVASHTPVLYTGSEQEVASFVFDPIPDQQRNIPFTITIRAVDSSGLVVGGFNEAVTLSANGTIDEGGGLTPIFTAGALFNHVVRFDETGVRQLTVVDGEGRTGISNEFNILEQMYALFINTDPPTGGSVSGQGNFAADSFADITATPAEGFRFVTWIGDGVDDVESSVAQVQMSEIRWLTAVFRKDSLPSYQDWASKYFLRNALNPAIAGPDRDPNKNGVTNLLEFAFGREPVKQEGARHMPHLSKGEDGATYFNYYRRAGHPQLTYRVLANASLSTDGWEEYSPQAEDVAVSSEDGEIEKVSIRITNPAGLFLRVQVSM